MPTPIDFIQLTHRLARGRCRRDGKWAPPRSDAKVVVTSAAHAAPTRRPAKRIPPTEYPPARSASSAACVPVPAQHYGASSACLRASRTSSRRFELGQQAGGEQFLAKNRCAHPCLLLPDCLHERLPDRRRHPRKPSGCARAIGPVCRCRRVRRCRGNWSFTSRNRLPHVGDAGAVIAEDADVP